jgi:DNA-binding response OmpR family regulator
MRVLVIEDELEFAELLKINLSRRGYAVDCCDNLADAQIAIELGGYDLLLLDRRLPDGDGVDLIRRLRAAGRSTPIILITAQDAVADRVEGLNAGGDDYLIKPFATDELVARMDAVLRRPAQASPQSLALGNLEFYPASREALVEGVPLPLPRRELAVLAMLMRRAGRVVTRDTLENGLYGHGDEVESNALEAHVSRLRKRLGNAGATVAVRTVRGIGYFLETTGGGATKLVP